MPKHFNKALRVAGGTSELLAHGKVPHQVALCIGVRAKEARKMKRQLWGSKQMVLRKQMLDVQMDITRRAWSQLAREVVQAGLYTRDEIRALLAGEQKLRAEALCKVHLHGHIQRTPEATVAAATSMLNALAAKSLTNRALEIMGVKTTEPVRVRYERLAVARLGEGVTPAELLQVVEWGWRQKNLNARRLTVIWGKDCVSWVALAKNPNPSISAVSDPQDRAMVAQEVLEQLASRGQLRHR